MKRGYFEIGIINGKDKANIGTLWRSAYQLGASGIFTIGARYSHQKSDTTKAIKHIPLRQYETFEEFMKIKPKEARLICVETGGSPLKRFVHPTSAIYLLGAEDTGIPEYIQVESDYIISLQSVNISSYNVSVAGTLVMYDRMFNK
jgi:tRNA G18 (ribose-2'-O)-methylase SpoU